MQHFFHQLHLLTDEQSLFRISALVGHDSYQTAFQRLLADLKAEASRNTSDNKT